MADPRQTAARYQRLLFVGIYALSGAAALLYEITWTRLLTLQMGHTVAAASTVLSAFMGGLAGGAWVVGRFRILSTYRLRVYAGLEIFVALSALALPALFRVLLPVLSWAYSDGDTPGRFALVRLLLSLGVLGLPTAAMGATFPIAAAWFANAAHSKSRTSNPSAAPGTSLLYAANSIGAAIGALTSGFWFIEHLGLSGTIWIGASMNGLSALSALWIAHKEDGNSTSTAELPVELLKSKAKKIPNQPKTRPQTAQPWPALAYIAIAVSGFLALVYEVIWTRLLELVIGPTTYAFTTMVMSFIGGIAIGSAAGARLSRRLNQPELWLAAMLIVTSTSASLAAWFASSHLPLIVASEITDPNAVFGPVITQEVLIVVAILLPMTVALGAAFSFALAIVLRGAETVAGDTGSVYAANTLGAIAGALTGGFLLLPRAGLHGTFIAMSYTGILCGGLYLAVLLLRRTANKLRAALMVVASLAAAVLIGLPHWNREVLASGAYLYSHSVPLDQFQELLKAGRVEYYKDGAVATVSVRRSGANLSLTVDGKVDASNGADMLTQRMLGVIPALLHNMPLDVGIIGLGSGVTAGSILTTGAVRHEDIVETSPEVVEASKLFSKENGNVLSAPQVRLIVGDGRSHLLLTRQQYDILISEPSNPWMAGVAALFTREFFAIARERLKPGGIFCQWAHTYEISPGDLRSIAETFRSVFPEGTIWLVGDGDLLLIGSKDKDILAHLTGISERWREGQLPADLADVGIEPPSAPFQLLSLLVGGPAELARYGSGAQIQTDDKLALEFTAPRAIYQHTTTGNDQALRSLANPSTLPTAVKTALRAASPQDWTARGRMALRAAAFRMAYDSFRQALALDNHNTDAYSGLTDAAGESHRIDEEHTWLASIVAGDPSNIEARLELSRVLAASGDNEAAVAAAAAAMQLRPSDPLPIEQLGSIFADIEDPDRLEPIAEQLVSRFPQRKEGYYYRAMTEYLRGRLPQALDDARDFTSRYPDYAPAQNLLGSLAAQTGHEDVARSAFEASLRLNPRDPSTYINLGVLYLHLGDPSKAIDNFAEAWALDESSTDALKGFHQAQEALAKQ